MTTYKYKGQSLSGARVSGVVRAYDEFEAVAKLRDTCAFITKIEPVKERGNALDKPIGFRLKDKELALLCSQFSIILTSGLSVMRCVEMVASQTRNKYTRRMLEKVAEEVGAGYSLAQSFESNAPYLPATFIETVRAGEESGTLALCFDRLHRYYERTAKTRAKIISTMTYPAMVIVVAIIVFIIIIAVAVPAFTDAFADLGEGELPGVTKALMAVSGFFNRWWWLLLLIAAAVVLALCLRGAGGETEKPAKTGTQGATNEARIAFLESYGWQVEPEPVKTQQVTVPADPSEVFLRYNELQISQGYDLLQYSGKELTRYVYRITNYPDESGVYYATLLVKDGQVVGADVASSAKTGVMHGLKMPE